MSVVLHHMCLDLRLIVLRIILQLHYNMSVSIPWTMSEFGPCLRLLFPSLLRGHIFQIPNRFAALAIGRRDINVTFQRCPCFVRFLFSRPFNRELCPSGEAKSKSSCIPLHGLTRPGRALRARDWASRFVSPFIPVGTFHVRDIHSCNA